MWVLDGQQDMSPVGSTPKRGFLMVTRTWGWRRMVERVPENISRGGQSKMWVLDGHQNLGLQEDGCEGTRTPSPVGSTPKHGFSMVTRTWGWRRMVERAPENVSSGAQPKMWVLDGHQETSPVG